MANIGLDIFRICESGTCAELEAFLSQPEHAFAQFLCKADGTTPLHACVHGNCDESDILAKITLLKAKGANVCVIGGKCSVPPIFNAIYNDLSEEIILALYHPSLVEFRDRYSENIISNLFNRHWERDEQLCCWISQTRKQCLEKFIKDYAHDYNDWNYIHSIKEPPFVDEDSNTIISYACKFLDAATVSILLETKPKACTYHNMHAKRLTDNVKKYSEDDSYGAKVLLVKFSKNSLFLCALQNRNDVKLEIVQVLCRIFNMTFVALMDTLGQFRKFAYMAVFNCMSIEKIRNFHAKLLSEAIPTHDMRIHVPHFKNDWEEQFLTLVEIKKLFLNVFFKSPSTIYGQLGDTQGNWIVYQLSAGTIKFHNNVHLEQIDFRSKAISTHNTHIFHEAIRTKNQSMIANCMATFVNPLIPDARGKMPWEFTSDAHLACKLKAYAQWSPSPVQKTWWYGPFFERRARTCMLLCARFKIPRHVGYIIIGHFAPSECVYIPNCNKNTLA